MIQPYSLGTPVTRIDGASIVTGTINGADAILSGSLTADRINATSIQASTVFIPAVAAGLNGGIGGTWLDGGAIRTGTIDAQRLNITGVITAINAEGSTTINGGKITTGTITVGHLAADTLSAGKIKASYLDVDGVIQVVNGGSVTRITGSGIETGAITTNHITTSGISADVIKAGSLTSQGTGGTYAPLAFTPSTVSLAITNSSTFSRQVGSFIDEGYIAGQTLTTYGWAHAANNGTFTIASVSALNLVTSANTLIAESAATGRVLSACAVGFKLSHTPFTITNPWGRQQIVQADFGNTIMVNGFPLGSALAIPLNALDFPPLDQISTSSRVFYRGNTAVSVRGGAPNIACLTVTRKKWNTSTSVSRLDLTIQPNSDSDNLDGMRYAKVVLQRQSAAMIASPRMQIDVNATAKTFTRTDGGNFLSDGFTASTTVNFRGFANAGNNAAFTISAVSASTITCSAASGLVTETGSGSQQASTGTVPMVIIGTYYIALPDRLYAHATDNNVANAYTVSFETRDSLITTGMPAATITLYNVYGASDTYCYYTRNNRNYDGVDLSSDGTSFPYGITGGTSGGTSSGGSGGGGGILGCVPAGTPLQTAYGELPIEEIRVGDLVVAYDDQTLAPLLTRVQRVFVYDNRQLYLLRTEIGEFICSHDHRLAKSTRFDGSIVYRPARTLKPDDCILFRGVDGEICSTYINEVLPLDRYERVYHVQLEEGHVYVAGGFLAHNLKPLAAT